MTGGYSFPPHDEAILLRPFCPPGFTMTRAVSGTAGRRFSLPINLLGVARELELGWSDAGLCGMAG